MKMDLAESKACLDEYRISLDSTCGMLRPTAGVEGELRSAIEKLNDSLIATLDVHRKEAVILSILVQEELSARMGKLLDFPAELTAVTVALKELRVAVDKADQARADHLRAIADDKARKEGIPVRSAFSLALEKFRRDEGSRAPRKNHS